MLIVPFGSEDSGLGSPDIRNTRQGVVMPKETSGYAECQFCDRAHAWYSVPTLAEQFDVDQETIRRRLWKVDHVKFGRSARIPQCQVNNLMDDTVEVTMYD